MTASTRADVGYGERLPRFSRVVDGYRVGARAKSILLATFDGDYAQTPYHREAEKLYNVGWLKDIIWIRSYMTGPVKFTLSPAGERVRDELRNL